MRSLAFWLFTAPALGVVVGAMIRPGVAEAVVVWCAAVALCYGWRSDQSAAVLEPRRSFGYWRRPHTRGLGSVSSPRKSGSKSAIYVCTDGFPGERRARDSISGWKRSAFSMR